MDRNHFGVRLSFWVAPSLAQHKAMAVCVGFCDRIGNLVFFLGRIPCNEYLGHDGSLFGLWGIALSLPGLGIAITAMEVQ